jgi:RND family efflux transporter MFP subunit
MNFFSAFPDILRSTILIGLSACVLHVQAADWVGLALPVADVQVSSSAAGLVQRIAVKPGRFVKPGETLVELDSSSQQVELRRRTVVLDDNSEIQTALQRLAALSDLLKMTEIVASNSQSISKEELVKARMEKAAAQGRVSQLEAQKARERVEHDQAQLELQQRTVRAPVAGVVVDVPLEVGEWAKPGDVIVRLADISQVELRLNLPQAAAASFRLGSRVIAHFEAGASSQPFTGVVNFVSPLADSASGLVDVRIRFANPKGRIRPGSKAVIRGAATSS